MPIFGGVAVFECDGDVFISVFLSQRDFFHLRISCPFPLGEWQQSSSHTSLLLLRNAADSSVTPPWSSYVVVVVGLVVSGGKIGHGHIGLLDATVEL